VTDHFQRSWAVVQKNLGAWVLYFLAFMGVSVVTGGLGMLLTFNVFRGVRDAVREERGPVIGSIFKLDQVQRDLPALATFLGAIFVGSAVGGIGGYLAHILLGWVPMLATEDRFASGDLWKISLKAAQDDWQELVVFSLIAGGITMASFCLCGVPLIVALPVCAVAQWLMYESHRDRLLEIAAAEGIPLLSASAE
jgi:hypothetical protein